MKLEIDFYDSEIASIHQSPSDLELILDPAVLVVSSSPSASAPHIVNTRLIIAQPKFKSLPKKGRLTDGELYGIPGKALNGRIPVSFQFAGECELVLSGEKTDYTIHGKGIRIITDLTKLPESLQKS